MLWSFIKHRASITLEKRKLLLVLNQLVILGVISVFLLTILLSRMDRSEANVKDTRAGTSHYRSSIVSTPCAVKTQVLEPQRVGEKRLSYPS